MQKSIMEINMIRFLHMKCPERIKRHKAKNHLPELGLAAEVDWELAMRVLLGCQNAL